MSEPGKNVNPVQASINQMAGMAGQIAGLSLILILAAVFGGRWLDNLLGTGHTILIILVIAAGPLSLFLTFKLALRAAQNIKNPSLPKKPDSGNKEDETGE